jgi:dipeptidase E
MKMYLSSYELGNETEKLKSLIPSNKRAGYIFNACDFTNTDLEKRNKRIETDTTALRSVGFEVEQLDLKGYFGQEEKLREKVKELGAIWVSGGNVFILRQAMKLSGFDTILKELNQRNDFLYGAYSAGVCVLSPTLKGYDIVDNASETPYEELKETLWDGLGIIDYTFLPHFKSDHPESALVDKLLQYCEEHNLPYKALRDGEVIVVE